MAVLLFDFDGVISDSLPVEIKYYLPICKRRKLDGIGSADDLKKLGEENLYAGLERIGVTPQQYLEAFNEFYDVLDKENYMPEPFPGIIELLKETALRHPVYIVTSNIYKFPDSLFTKYNVTGIRGILGLEVESSKVKKIDGIKKKHPNDKIYFITDTTGDIKEARGSLADVIAAVTWGWHSKELLTTANADIMFDSVTELREYIENEI